jgi:hypothetical protein
MTAAIHEQVVEQVQTFWAENPHWSARAVAREYIGRYGDDKIKERKIIEIVSTAKKAAPKQPFPFAEWKPWGDPQETAEETYFLLLLNCIKNAESGVSLYQHEARWARRLRVDVAGLSPYSQYKLVSLYGMREVIDYYLNRPQCNDDLDAFVAFKPWRPHSNWTAYHIYLRALQAGVVPFPEVDPRVSLGEGIDPASMPGVRFPQGPGPEQYPDLDHRLRSGLLWLLMPPKELPPDRESDPQKREMLQLLLELWRDEMETSDSFQVKAMLAAMIAERYANEEEQGGKQLVKN